MGRLWREGSPWSNGLVDQVDLCDYPVPVRAALTSHKRANFGSDGPMDGFDLWRSNANADPPRRSADAGAAPLLVEQQFDEHSRTYEAQPRLSLLGMGSHMLAPRLILYES